MHSIHLKRPVEAVSQILLDDPAAWFPVAVGVHIVGIPVRKNVTIEFGQAVTTSTWSLLPLKWKATPPDKLFPVMTGKVELAAVSKDETRLTVSGMYEPPLGKLGVQLDEALMHRIAQGTVEELAGSIAEQLERAIRA